MCVIWYVFVLFFFKQKTAYEMRIRDWSSDVCSSDLGSKAQHFAPWLPKHAGEFNAEHRSSPGITCHHWPRSSAGLPRHASRLGSRRNTASSPTGHGDGQAWREKVQGASAYHAVTAGFAGRAASRLL